MVKQVASTNPDWNIRRLTKLCLPTKQSTGTCFESEKDGAAKVEELALPFIFLCPGPEVIKLFPCSTQLSMKFFLLKNVKMPTFICRKK